MIQDGSVPAVIPPERAAEYEKAGVPVALAGYSIGELEEYVRLLKGQWTRLASPGYWIRRKLGDKANANAKVYAERIAEELVRLAFQEDLSDVKLMRLKLEALRELTDRMDGRPMVSVAVSGETQTYVKQVILRADMPALPAQDAHKHTLSQDVPLGPPSPCVQPGPS